jgi:hypothetical protein
LFDIRVLWQFSLVPALAGVRVHRAIPSALSRLSAVAEKGKSGTPENVNENGNGDLTCRNTARRCELSARELSGVSPNAPSFRAL